MNHAEQQAVVDATPLEEIDVSRPELFQTDTWQPWFARLRREAPVHFRAESVNGPFWSVTSHKLIKEVDANHQIFSSEAGGIGIVDPRLLTVLPIPARGSTSILPRSIRSCSPDVLSADGGLHPPVFDGKITLVIRVHR